MYCEFQPIIFQSLDYGQQETFHEDLNASLTCGNQVRLIEKQNFLRCFDIHLFGDQ